MKRPELLRWSLLLILVTLVAGCGSAAPGATTATSSPTAGQGETPVPLPQGVTAEGYHYLGQPNAPVTIENYSDFL